MLPAFVKGVIPIICNPLSKRDSVTSTATCPLLFCVLLPPPPGLFPSNVSLGAELVFDLQADNSTKETYRNEMIIAANINFVATLVFFIIKSALCIKLDSLSSAATRRI